MRDHLMGWPQLAKDIARSMPQVRNDRVLTLLHREVKLITKPLVEEPAKKPAKTAVQKIADEVQSKTAVQQITDEVQSMTDLVEKSVTDKMVEAIFKEFGNDWRHIAIHGLKLKINHLNKTGKHLTQLLTYTLGERVKVLSYNARGSFVLARLSDDRKQSFYLIIGIYDSGSTYFNIVSESRVSKLDAS